MLQSKVIDESNTYELQRILNEFLAPLQIDQIVNIFYASNATQNSRSYSVIVLYNTESNEPHFTKCENEN